MGKMFKRAGSEMWYFQGRVSAAVIAKVGGQPFELEFPASGAHPSWKPNVKFKSLMQISLGTDNTRLAKFRNSMAEVELDRCCDRVRNGSSVIASGPVRDTARILFDLFMDQYGDPDQPLGFDFLAIDGLKRISEEKMTYLKSFPTDYGLKDLHFDQFDPSTRTQDALESRYGALCTWLGIITGIDTQQDRYSLMDEFERSLNQARIEHSKRRRPSDIRNTESLQTRPVTFSEIFDHWKRETTHALNTRRSWTSVIKQFTTYLGHEDASKVTTQDVRDWKLYLLNVDGKSIKTIQSSSFPCIRRMFSFAVETHMLIHDPTSGIRISTKGFDSEEKTGYTIKEVHYILEAARKENKPSIRWLPFLAAATGARIGELSQLWQEQIKQDDETGIWYIDIRPSPDGGYIKNRESRRKVPLHPAIETEFLAFVDTRKGMPLFYKPRKLNPEKIHPAQNITAPLGVWIRSLELDHKNKSPNHAFRHTFKTTVVNAGVSEDIADVLQGHTRQGVSRRYLKYEMKQLLDAVSKISIPNLPQG